jgi:hypothetical protein
MNYVREEIEVISAPALPRHSVMALAFQNLLHLIAIARPPSWK